MLRNAWRAAARKTSETGDVELHATRDDGVDLAERERLELALTALPSSYQEVLRCRYQGGEAVAEIATRWGRSHKAVESLLTRAREAFRVVWQRWEGPEGDRT